MCVSYTIRSFLPVCDRERLLRILRICNSRARSRALCRFIHLLRRCLRACVRCARWLCMLLQPMQQCAVCFDVAPSLYRCAGAYVVFNIYVHKLACVLSMSMAIPFDVERQDAAQHKNQHFLTRNHQRIAQHNMHAPVHPGKTRERER